MSEHDEVFDFSDIKGLEPLDPGRYAVMVIKADSGISNAGEKKVDVRLQVTDPVEFENRLIFDAFSFHPNALPFTKEKLVGIGMGDFKGSPEDLAEDLMGLDFVVYVDIQEGQERDDGQPGEKYPDRNRVKKYLAPGTSLSADRVSSLD